MENKCYAIDIYEKKYFVNRADCFCITILVIKHLKREENTKK